MFESYIKGFKAPYIGLVDWLSSITSEKVAYGIGLFSSVAVIVIVLSLVDDYYKKRGKA